MDGAAAAVGMEEQQFITGCWSHNDCRAVEGIVEHLLNLYSLKRLLLYGRRILLWRLLWWKWCCQEGRTLWNRSMRNKEKGFLLSLIFVLERESFKYPILWQYKHRMRSAILLLSVDQLVSVSYVGVGAFEIKDQDPIKSIRYYTIWSTESI